MSESELLISLLNRAKEFQKKYRFRPLDDINLFSILNMENKEVSAHSAVLYYILKPFENDAGSIDDENLRIFLRELGVECSKVPLDIQREVWTDFGRLDFLVTVGSDRYVLELKIWAGGQPDQIKRYQQYLESDGFSRENIFFLTPDKRQSLTGFSKNITLKQEVNNALTKIIKRREADEKKEYCVILQQYLNLINKLTGVDFMEIENSILKSEEDLRAIQTLKEQQETVLTSIMTAFFDDLAKELCMGFDMEGYPKASLSEYDYGRKEAIQKYYKSRNKTWPALAFKIEQNLSTHSGLYFFIEVENNLYVGISPRKSVEQNLEQISTKEEAYQNMKGKKVTNVFLDWEYITLNNSLIDFSMNGLSSPTSFVKQLLVPGSLQLDEAKMQQIIKEIKQKYCELCKAVFKLGEK